MEPSREVRVRIDQDQARLLGLSQTLAETLNAVMSGTPITQVRDGIYLVNVVARANDEQRVSLSTLRSLQLPLPGGRTVPLSQIATQRVMLDISQTLRRAYHVDDEGGGVTLVPGGGTYAMEAVARQLAHGKKVLVVRNGWFSYRWTQIFEAGDIPAESIVLKARRIHSESEGVSSPSNLSRLTRPWPLSIGATKSHIRAACGDSLRHRTAGRVHEGDRRCGS